jgi:hypothetical protein
MSEHDALPRLSLRFEAKQETLLLQLRQRFGKKVTPTVAVKIHKTRDAHTRDEWLGKVLEAGALEDVGILTRK